MILVDSHCHLNMYDKSDVENIISRANDASVSYLHTICTKLDEIDDILCIASEYANIFASVGVHPNLVLQDVCKAAQLMELSKHPKVISFGETGLDYYHKHDKGLQKQSLINHIEAASISGLPVIIHTREAMQDTIDILQSEMHNQSFFGLIHCFTGDINFARAIIDIGLYISVSGVVTFKNAVAVQDAVKWMPLDRILIETDSPYLAPVPFRGKRNEPAYVRFIAERIAELKNIDIAMVADVTMANFFKLFRKARLHDDK